MAQPIPYVPSYNFTDWQTGHPTDPLPADEIDAQFNSLRTFSQQVCTNLTLIQRDDGELANNSVGIDQLDSSIDFGFSTLTDWATLTIYKVRDGVYFGSNVYRCVVAHTSGVFATDLASGYWVLVLNLNQFLAPAQAAATAAANSATAANNSAIAAAASVANLSGTSTTSNTLGIGTINFTTQAGKYFGAGTPVTIASASSPGTRFMTGVVSSYTGTALAVAVTRFSGSGTYADWGIQVSGVVGLQGADGPPGPGTGDMLKANNLSDVVSATTSRSNLGLGNVDNTSDATKNAAAVTLANKTLTNPTINSMVFAGSASGLFYTVPTIITTTSTFTTAANSSVNTVYEYTLIGAGGGGGGSGNASSAAGGGGSGALCYGQFSGIAASTGITVTVGAGGAGGGAGAAGGAGGNTSLGAPLNATALGGGGGSAGAGSSAGGASNGTNAPASQLLGLAGARGLDGFYISSNYTGGNGGATPLGYGAGGIAGHTNAASPTALPTGFGSGGAGAVSIAAGTAGAPGLVIIRRITP